MQICSGQNECLTIAVRDQVGEEYTLTVRSGVRQEKTIGVSYDAFIDDVQVGSFLPDTPGM